MKIEFNGEIVELKDREGNVLTDEQIIRNHMIEVQKEKDIARTWKERYFSLLNLLETTVEKEDKLYRDTIYKECGLNRDTVYKECGLN